nr:tyrosine--tRNA ligase [Saprospiraceae bacterium]
VGKHLTVNYMMAKDSVKSRLDSGISFTEFSYQLLQGYDFYWLFKNKGVKLEMGGSDQWGNITAGTELIRRMDGGDAYALTCPLITKADGTKFGKSEGGNVWLDAALTSPYKFYQYFLNTSDEDAVKFLKVFSLKSISELESIIAEHEGAKGARIAQKALAEELTIRVHSQEDLDAALKASKLLFGKSGKEDLQSLTSNQLLEVFEAVPQSEVSRAEVEAGIPIFDFVADKTGFYASKSDARRTMKEGGLRINKEQLKDEDYSISPADLLNDEFILVQKGKKNYFLARLVH